jgi:DNA repair photolyase
MKPFQPEIIYIENSVKKELITRNILRSLPNVPVEYIKEPLKIEDQTITKGKKIIQIIKQKGSFLAECPCSPDMLDCGYFVLRNAFNCDLDCTYCFLQSYVNNRIMTVSANIKDMFAEIDDFLQKNKQYTKKNPLRLGTGEFTDSLTLDLYTELSCSLIEYFAGKENVIFEFKTKTDNISNILKYKNIQNIVVAWSVNTPKMIKDNEFKTATLKERLAAAKKCAEQGFKIAFHFDPLIYYPDWEIDYQEVVHRLFKAVPKDQIYWISLGTFRFNKPLKPIVRKRFPENPIVAGEFIEGLDGKQRYFKDIRLNMYKKMLKMIKQLDPEALVYLCMEAAYIWKKVSGAKVETADKLQELFTRKRAKIKN